MRLDLREPTMDDHAHHGRCAAHAHDGHDGHHHAPPSESIHTVKDPVCGMDVDPHTAKHRREHAGRTYYFCSAGCRTKFAADPERYLGENAPAVPAPKDAIYTCPMHPEVRQVGPGSCPICGMALEPLDVTADAG